MSNRICVVGSIHMDLIISLDNLPKAGDRLVANSVVTCTGGKGANQAVAASRLGADVDLVGCVGSDGWGGDLRSALIGEGVDVQHVTTKAGVASGVGIVTALPNGELAVVVAPGADRELSIDDVEQAREAIEAAAVVVIQLEIPVPAVQRACEIAQAAGAKVILNASPAIKLPPEMYAGVDTLIVEFSEAQVLLSDEEDLGQARIARRLGALGPDKVVVMDTGRSAVLFDGERVIEQASMDLEVVDSTGSRDAFVGAIAVARLEGSRLDEALRSACAAGALASNRVGALPSMPTREEHEGLLKKMATA
ncbi:MAG: ribokinase [Planctomycetota bacterium]|jgi:ribokinase